VVGAAVLTTALLITFSTANDTSHELAPHSDDEAQSPNAEQNEVTRDTEADVFDEVTARVGVEPNATQETENTVASCTMIKMRFLDSSRIPLAGVAVEARIARSSHTTESGSSGTAEIAIPAREDSEPNFLSVKATLPWHVPFRKSMRVKSGDQMELGEIVLESAGAVSGRVLDRTGLPIKEIAVFCTGPEIGSLNMDEARREGLQFSRDRISCGSTGSDGTFTASAVKVGSRRFWSGGMDYLYSYSDPVEVAAGMETHGVELVLDERPREQLIECVVLDPEGNPVPKAFVEITAKGGGHGSTTDHEGRYRRLLRREGPYSLEATDPEGRYEKVRLEDVKPGTPDLVLQFMTPSRKLRLRVSSSGNENLGEFMAVVWSRGLRSLVRNKDELVRMGGFGGLGECYHETFKPTDGAEETTVSITLPKSDFFVTVWAAGYRTVELGPFSGLLVTDPIEIVLDPVAGVSGRVLSNGVGVEGARVSLHRQVDPEHPIAVVGFDSRSEKDATDSVVTDPEGYFVLHPSSSDACFLRAIQEGFAPTELGPLVFDPREGQDGLELRLTRGGAIAGHVVMAPGRDPAGAVVGASRGDGFPVVVQADENGAFRFDQLTPGPWLLEKRHQQDLGFGPVRMFGTQTGNPWKRPVSWSCVVEEGKTTHCDLDLRHETVCILKGTVQATGLLSSGWGASIRPVDYEFGSLTRIQSFNINSRASVSLDGSFTLRVLETGTYTLSLNGPIGKDIDLRIQDKVELTGGEMAWDWSIPFTKVEVRPPPSGLEGSNRLTYRWSGEGDRKATVTFRLESNEPVLLYAVPSGRFRIEQSVKGSAGERMILAELEAKPGDTTVVTLQ
jgi:hypothetical protein